MPPVGCRWISPFVANLSLGSVDVLAPPFLPVPTSSDPACLARLPCFPVQ